MTRETDPSYHSFSTTIWSLVGRARRGDGEEQKKALDQLLRRYLPALRAYLVHRKHLQVAFADDLLQEFLLNKVVERDIIGKAVPGIGRFRYFLLKSLDHFLVSEHRRTHTKARFADGVVPIDETIDAAEARPEPQNAFDVAWAKQLLSDTVESMRKKCDSIGRPDVWDVFQGRLLDPLLHGAEPASYAGLVARHHLVSPDKASNLRVTARRMFVSTLRDQIAEYEPDEVMVDEEIADLMRILSGGKD
jgi:DNA-directed RNA polymerase specialized sigma24 family protein